MKKENCTFIGTLGKTHGREGALLLPLDADFARTLKDLKFILADMNGGLVPFFIKHLKVANNALIVEFEDYNTPEKAREFVGRDVYLLPEQMPPADEERFYPHEINGYQIIDIEKGLLGVANDLLDYNSNVLIQAFDGENELLIPFNDAFIHKINKRKKIIEVSLPEGLIGLNS